MSITKRQFRFICVLAGVSLISVAATASAQGSQYTYKPLVGIPGITDNPNLSLGEYFNALYLFTISLGALIGVIKISMAGVKYSMSDVVTDKADAKKDIGGVLLGLAILVIPALVLNEINPNLTNLDVLKSAPKVLLKPSAPNTPPFTAYECQGTQTQSGDPEAPTYSCIPDCSAECSTKGGTFTPYPNQPGVFCPKGRCSK